MVDNFGFEWLRLRDVDKIDPDPILFPQFDNGLRTAFRREMELFLNSIIEDNRSVVDILGANYTFLNERLAAHYGVRDVRGDQFRRVTLTDSRRWGILGKGAMLMVTSYPNRTAPVLRGARIAIRSDQDAFPNAKRFRYSRTPSRNASLPRRASICRMTMGAFR